MIILFMTGPRNNAFHVIILSGIFTSENGMNKSWDEYKTVFKSDLILWKALFRRILWKLFLWKNILRCVVFLNSEKCDWSGKKYLWLKFFFICLFVSNKRQNGWTDRVQIFCVTSRNPRESLWSIEFSKICLHQNSIFYNVHKENMLLMEMEDGREAS